MRGEVYRDALLIGTLMSEGDSCLFVESSPIVAEIRVPTRHGPMSEPSTS